MGGFITGAPASNHYHLCYLCEHFIPATPMPKAISSLSALHAACSFKLLTFSLVELQQNAPGVKMPCAWCQVNAARSLTQRKATSMASPHSIIMKHKDIAFKLLQWLLACPYPLRLQRVLSCGTIDWVLDSLNYKKVACTSECCCSGAVETHLSLFLIALYSFTQTYLTIIKHFCKYAFSDVCNIPV